MFAWGAARLGPELLVSAWPEPLSAIPADSTAEPTAGAIESSRTVQSRLHRLHCATDCAIQCVGLSAVASGKPALYVAPLRRGFFVALVSAARHRNQRLGSAFRWWLAADARAPSLSIPLVRAPPGGKSLFGSKRAKT